MVDSALKRKEWKARTSDRREPAIGLVVLEAECSHTGSYQKLFPIAYLSEAGRSLMAVASKNFWVYRGSNNLNAIRDRQLQRSVSHIG
ncbi:hypothetical protein J6590_079454 [Homalodisca vitripennis]|nr:hypothetical protein J6590_079454 [Homalodisca vitripennis]